MAQNSIIELQVINYVVKNKALDILRNNNISADNFSEVYKNIISFIFHHNDTYGVVPDEPTLLSQFGDDYTVLDVSESPQYLVDKLKSFLAYIKYAKDFNEAKEIMDRGDISGALNFLKSSAEDALTMFGSKSNGTDITKDLSRIEDYEKRLSGESEQTYSLGMDSLDETFGGLLNDDVLLLFARLGHGKSYLATYIAHALHSQGLKVLFYSGEMEANQVGYRFDSIDSHFSNKSLLFGRTLQGKSYAEYKTYLDKLSHAPNYFKVITPADLDGRFINMNDIHSFVKELSPDVIFIDQLSLVEDVRSTKATVDRIRYGNIMADLRVLSNTKRIPIVVVAQANRSSATKDETGEFVIPEMSHIAESDAIGHHCTRAIAFCTNKVEDTDQTIMKIAVKKNRHGDACDFKVAVDFEHGVFEELKHKMLRADNTSSGGF